MALMFLSRRINKCSNINLSHTNPTTLAPGNLTPISFTRIVTGDRIKFTPSTFVQCMPMKAPLVNGFKVCLEYFFIPDRLYNVNLLLDRRDVTDDPSSVNYPFFTVPVMSASQTITSATAQNIARNIVLPHSLADYCDFPVGYLPVGYSDETSDDALSRRRFNAVKAIGYLDVVNTYYVNQHVDTIPTACWSRAGNKAQEKNIEYNHSRLQNLIDYIKLGQGLDISEPAAGGETYTRLGTWQWLCSRASIFQRSFPDYYLESWVKSSGYSDAEVQIEVDPDSGSVSMRNISAMSHIQRFKDLATAGGSRFSDFLNSEFDTSSLRHTTSPLYLGSDRQYLGSNVIYQTNGFDNELSPLGAFAGQSNGGDRFRTRRYKFGEPGYFMVMASLVPDVIYSRGINPLNRELTLADSYAPALDNISMQPLMVEELDAQGNTNFSPVVSFGDGLKVVIQDGDAQLKNRALGFVPAWSHMMQQISRAHGRTATTLRYWMLHRDYGVDPLKTDARTWLEEYAKLPTSNTEVVEALSAFIELAQTSKSFTPYVRSNGYNSVFYDIANGAQNFVLTFSCALRVNREKSKVNVPNTI